MSRSMGVRYREVLRGYGKPQVLRGHPAQAGTFLAKLSARPDPANREVNDVNEAVNLAI